MVNATSNVSRIITPTRASALGAFTRGSKKFLVHTDQADQLSENFYLVIHPVHLPPEQEPEAPATAGDTSYASV